MLKIKDNIPLAVLEKFYAYFDDSLVSENKKQELRQALDEAKNKPVETQNIKVDEIVEEEAKQAVETEYSRQKGNIER